MTPIVSRPRGGNQFFHIKIPIAFLTRSEVEDLREQLSNALQADALQTATNAYSV